MEFTPRSTPPTLMTYDDGLVNVFVSLISVDGVLAAYPASFLRTRHWLKSRNGKDNQHAHV